MWFVENFGWVGSLIIFASVVALAATVFRCYGDRRWFQLALLVFFLAAIVGLGFGFVRVGAEYLRLQRSHAHAAPMSAVVPPGPPAAFFYDPHPSEPGRGFWD